MPKVDVIIPAYNAAKYLPAAIESVVTQTFEDWRILLIDDGSTDKTAEVVAPYIEQLGPKLKYIYQPNAGLPAARNAAIRNSSAELLALLDADDVWLPNRLAESVKCFDGRPQVGLSYGLVLRVDENDGVIDTFKGNPGQAEGRIATDIYTRRIQLPCPTMTFRRSAVDEVGLFDETMRATEDRDMWLRIALKYEVALVPKVIAHYRIWQGSMSTDLDRMEKAQTRFVEKHYGAPGCGSGPRRVALSRIYRNKAEALEARGQRGAAVKNLLRASITCPFDLDNVRRAGTFALRWTGFRS
jgi:glycosyltransferase involved in cell wall biosynthesis